MSIREEALDNLKMAGLFDKDSDYGGMLGEAVMRLVDAHCSEGHSGFSHEMALQIFNKVIRGHALTAAYWDKRKLALDKFAEENMGEPWKEEMVLEMIGPRPTPSGER